MVDIRPFRAIRYTEKAGDPKNLITLPYDKIDSAMQKSYYSRSPYNFCRLILPTEENKYEVARQRIDQWTREGVLAKEEQPAVFVSRQEFTLAGKTRVRTGLIAALRLYSYDENIVFPHEVTYSEPKADRLNMLRKVQKDLEPVFLIYADPDNRTIDFFAETAKTKPTIEVVDSYGVKHTVWRISDPQKLEFLRKEMEDKNLVITDGHHRYESAIAYRDERRSKTKWTKDSAFNFHMCYMVPVQDEGLVVFPTHRILKGFKLSKSVLEEFDRFFTVSEIGSTAEAAETYLEGHYQEKAFCVYDGSKVYGLLLKDDINVVEIIDAGCPKEACVLGVVILRNLVFKYVIKTGEMQMDKHIVYAGSVKEAFEKVKDKEGGLAFLVRPINPKLVWQIALKHWRLPEKSTDFYPKPVSGLTIMDISSYEAL